MLDTTHLQKYIDTLERDREKIDEQLTKARELLTEAEGRQTRLVKSPQTEETAPDQPFSPKYDEDAETLILRELRKAKRRVTARYLIDELKNQGKEFHRATFDLTLKKLVNKGKAVRHKAPKDSRYKYEWSAT